MVRSKSKISQTQRLESIRQVLLSTDEVSVEKLARKFRVSDMTIRRDLEFLESQGEVIRTYGGAALARKLIFEFAFRNKQNEHQKHKTKIAEQAVKHVKDEQVVMLDTGTTTLAIAREIVGKRKVTMITTSLAIVSEMQFATGIRVILLGGFLRGGSPDMHGPLTEENVDRFHADIAFMGADAIDTDGNIYTNDLRVVNLDRKMVSNSAKVIVVADSGKFGNKAMCRVFGPGDYDVIISDSRISKKTASQLAKRKIAIELA